METFKLLAEPWWVNLFIAVPFIVYYPWVKRGLTLSLTTLITAAIFGVAFGYVESSVVVYLRAAIGLLPGYGGTLSDVARLSSDTFQQVRILSDFPRSLIVVEIFRELATVVMLSTLAMLSAKQARDRWAIFFWTFAFWDIFYYVGLWALVRWPASLLTLDVLFLIPVPWYSQVWYPILISVLFISAVILSRNSNKRLKRPF